MSTSVLALDKMMRTLTDADRESMRATVPIQLVDQFDAATAETDRLFRGMGTEMRSPVGGIDFANVPDWLRLTLVDTWAGFIGGTIDTCQHAPRMDRPEPVVSAAWRPGLIVCSHCIHLTKATGVADLTCDRCGRVCAGLDHGEGIHPCSLSFGPMLYFFGLCPDCMTEHKDVMP